MECDHSVFPECVVLGEDVQLEITLTGDGVTDISSPTATVGIYTIPGATVLAPAAMTDDGGITEVVFSYILTTGGGQTITAAGHYRATYVVTLGTRTIQKYQDILIEAVPTYDKANLTTEIGVG